MMKRTGGMLTKPKLAASYRTWFRDWKQVAAAEDARMKKQLVEELEREKEKRVAGLQQQGLKRLRNQGLARGWSAWHGKWAERVRKLRVMKQAGGWLTKPKLIAAYSSWRRDWESEMLHEKHMTHEQRIAAEVAKRAELQTLLEDVTKQLAEAQAAS